MPRTPLVSYRVLHGPAPGSGGRTEWQEVYADDLVVDGGNLYALQPNERRELVSQHDRWHLAHAIDDDRAVPRGHAEAPDDVGGVHWGTAGCMITSGVDAATLLLDMHPCVAANVADDGGLVVRGEHIARNGRRRPVTRGLYPAKTWRHALLPGDSEPTTNPRFIAAGAGERTLHAEASGIYGALRSGGYDPHLDGPDPDTAAIETAREAGLDWSALPPLHALDRKSVV
mgnify:CR=1 FL=1